MYCSRQYADGACAHSHFFRAVSRTLQPAPLPEVLQKLCIWSGGVGETTCIAEETKLTINIMIDKGSGRGILTVFDSEVQYIILKNLCHVYSCNPSSVM